MPLYHGYDTSKYNGLDANKGNVNKGNANNVKVPYKFIYSSFPNRGLLPLLEMWAAIVQRQPLASLHIFSDVDGKWVNGVAGEQMQKIKGLLAKYAATDGGLNITYHGWTNKDKLAEGWNTSEYWFYPCTFMETFCLTALEAAISKTIAITSDLAALNNTVGNRGIMIPGNPESWEWKNNALIKLFEIMEDKERKQYHIQRNWEWASSLTWENQANKLLLIMQTPTQIQTLMQTPTPLEKVEESKETEESKESKETEEHEIVLKIEEIPSAENVEQKEAGNESITDSTLQSYSEVDDENNVKNLDYKQMFNWTNDLPLNNNAKNIFENIIIYFITKNIANPSILEVGVWSGTSLINIVSRIPNSTAVAIDSWTNYNERDFEMVLTGIEEAFHENVRKSGMKERITAVKGKSVDVMMNMIVSGQLFNFIYVDGSHLCLDCYIDLILAWKLLRKGGIIAIDDYLFNTEKTLESPFEAVNHFIKTNKAEMKILNLSYRVFIEKI